MQKVAHHATIILSDIHLGKDVCRADMLLEFLAHNTSDVLILNGDILDGWAIQRRVGQALPDIQIQVLDVINARAAAGTQVVFLPGNHDADLRRPDILGHTHFGIHFTNSYVHTDKQGRRFVVLHGDQFDPPLLQDRRASILSHIGDAMYDALIAVNILINKVTHDIFGRRVHLSAFLKHKTKKLVRALGGFSRKVVDVAKADNAIGILCGHIHYAEWTSYRGIMYGNSGDWVEGCTALCESPSGDWQIIKWFNVRRSYGLRRVLSKIPAANAGQDFDQVTAAQLAAIRKIWPPLSR